MFLRLLHAGGSVVLLAVVGCSGEPEPDPAVGSPALTYPEGPYGIEQGDIIANLEFESLDGEPLLLESFYEGDAGAAILYVTATWCFTCGPAIDWLNDYPPRKDGRLAARSVLLQNKQFENATAADAAQYDAGYGTMFPTLLDPNGELDVFRAGGLIPLNLVIDTTSMRITHREFGFEQTSMEQAVEAIVGER